MAKTKRKAAPSGNPSVKPAGTPEPALATARNVRGTTAADTADDASGSGLPVQKMKRPSFKKSIRRVQLVNPASKNAKEAAQEFVQLWEDLIDNNNSPSISFTEYKELVDDVLAYNPQTAGNYKTAPNTYSTNGPSGGFDTDEQRNTYLKLSGINSSQAYSLIQYATQVYVYTKLGLPNTSIPSNGISMYVDYITERVSSLSTAADEGFLDVKQLVPVELIWSYWLEEGMLVQTMNAIIKRFQNIKNGPGDPLANLELDPLRPVSNILWGYVQQLPFRLTIQRRAYEYDHHYGLRIFGKAIPNFTPADSRSKFLEAFHNLLYKCTIFFKESDDMTVNADAFPVLNALVEVHKQLSEGMHNQYSDLPVTSKVEMLIDQYILSRREIWEFLRGRTMVVYDEPWMGQVDAMKSMQGWTNTSISYYHNLATLGETILLSIRFTPWSQSGAPSSMAASWANMLRDSIQKYIYSYQVVTGVDLSVDKLTPQRNDIDIMPSVLISQKLQKDRYYGKLR
jgi:hypothetical protein